MNKIMNSLCGLMMAVLASGSALVAHAADVSVGLSSRETYVGLPVILRIQVANASKAEPPVVPSIDGVEIKALGAPSLSTQNTTINGRTTTSTTQTFAYELSPRHAGTFRISPVTVEADGVSQRTRPLEFVASKSETGDLLFVEIAGKQKQIYVGQALDLTLKIWLRPYSDRRLKITLSEGDMWRLISDRSEWGPFAERIQQLVQNDQWPVGKEVLRKDAQGVEHSYYLYQLDTTIYPKRPGTIDGNNVRIIANYPTALGRSRGLFGDMFEDMPGGGTGPFGEDDGFSPFGARLTVQTVRPLAEQAVVEPIKVLPIPTAGRPADYRGAVGVYQIATDASPTNVKSGDPINLVIGISGTGPMELVQAPPLAELPELGVDYKVPNEPLAGFVKGDRKIFQTTIRPRKPGISRIPAIPFSYFDPDKEKFVTVHSNPIAINVDQAEMLALDSVVHNGQSAGTNSKASQPAATNGDSASLAIFTDDNLLANQAPWTLNWKLLGALLIAPPLAVVGIVLIRARTVFWTITSRFGSETRRLETAINRATDPAEIARAIRRFAARQVKLNHTSVNDDAIIGALRVSNHRNLAIRCERLLNVCVNENSAVPVRDECDLGRLKTEAIQWLHDWQTESLRQRPKPNATKLKSARSADGPASPVRSSTVNIVVAFFIIASLLASQHSLAQAAAPENGPREDTARVELSDLQQQSLLAEANKSYNIALEKIQSDSAEAKQGFSDAADKYQLLVRAGITNSRLYFNVANAYLESGQTSKAIANYIRCLRIEPTMQEAQTNLKLAKKMVALQTDPGSVEDSASSLTAYATIANEWLNSRVRPQTVFMAMVVVWIALWMLVALRLLGFRYPWKSATTISALLFIFFAVSTKLSWHTSSHPLAVVVQAPLASSYGRDASTAQVSPGQIVEPIQKRGESIRIRTSSGETVWLPNNSLEVI